MGNAQPLFSLMLVKRVHVQEAFAFHVAAASNDRHLQPRTQSELEAFAEGSQLFIAKSIASDNVVGLCYVVPFTDHEWELGGMCVARNERRSDVATALGVFAIAHTVVHDRPWFYGDEIVAYVAAENEAGLLLIQSSSLFVHVPDGIDSDAPGDATETTAPYKKFLFSHDALHTLTAIFNICFMNEHSVFRFFTRRHSLFRIEPRKLSDVLQKGLKAALRDAEHVT